MDNIKCFISLIHVQSQVLAMVKCRIVVSAASHKTFISILWPVFPALEYDAHVSLCLPLLLFIAAGTNNSSLGYKQQQPRVQTPTASGTNNWIHLLSCYYLQISQSWGVLLIKAILPAVYYDYQQFINSNENHARNWSAIISAEDQKNSRLNDKLHNAVN